MSSILLLILCRRPSESLSSTVSDPNLQSTRTELPVFKHIQIKQTQTGTTVDCKDEKLKNNKKCYHLVSVDVEDLDAASLTMQILLILCVDVDDLSAVPSTTMSSILLLIL